MQLFKLGNLGNIFFSETNEFHNLFAEDFLQVDRRNCNSIGMNIIPIKSWNSASTNKAIII